MTTKLNLTKMTFGSDDAELDEKHGFLDKVFLRTSIYNRAKEGQREIVLGRKGAGKSAICLMLKNAFELEGVATVLVTPRSLSVKKIEQLKVNSINKDETYLLGWKYVLLVFIGLEIVVNSHKLKTSRNNSHLKTKLKKVRQFLVDNNEIEKSIFDKFLGLLKLLSKLFTKVSIKVAGVEGAIETRQLDYYKDAADELENLQDQLKSIVMKQKNYQIVLLIDKVDEVWNQTEESALTIIGLIKSVHELNSTLQFTRIILFLRSDIYETLKFNDSDKFRSLEERLEWRDEDLKHLIANRGKFSAGVEGYDSNIIWDVIFEKDVNGQPTFEYILERTMRRPRELIQFCNNALANAQDNNQSKIFAKNVIYAEKQYSNWKLKDLASEFLVQYPYLDELFGLFQGFKSYLSREEFKFRYQETATKLASKYDDISTTSSDKMLQILFNIGFLGARIDEEDCYVFDKPTILLAKFDVMSVHPAFRLALGLEEAIIVDDEIKINLSGAKYINVGGDLTGNTVIVGGGNIIGSFIDTAVGKARRLKQLSDRLSQLEQQKPYYEQRAKSGISFHKKRQLEDINIEINNTKKMISDLKKN